MAFKYADIGVLEGSILDDMDAIQSQLVDNGIYTLRFLEGGSLQLEDLEPTDVDKFSPFPPNNVVRRLIG